MRYFWEVFGGYLEVFLVGFRGNITYKKPIQITYKFLIFSYYFLFFGGFINRGGLLTGGGG